jgi:PST family polysaccharide transporter/lipopolysaccharide exporter
MLPVIQVTNVVTKVMFPAFSIIQDDSQQLRQRFLETIQILSFFTIPLAGMIFVFSHDFVLIFLGKKWLAAVQIIHIFSLLGLISSVSSSTGSFFIAIGKPRIVTTILTARLMIIAIIIYPLTSTYGVYGAALTVLISAIILDPFAIFLVCKISKNSFLSVCKSIFIPFLNTFIVVFLVLFLKRLIFWPQTLFYFLLLAILSVGLYILIAILFDMIFMDGSIKRIRRIIGHLNFKAAS